MSPAGAESLPSRSGLKPGQVKCPRCGRPAEWQGNPWRPFCSERCKLMDLAAWADAEYAVPGEELPKEGEGE